MATQLWVDKYRPWKLGQICGNEASIGRLVAWLRAWPSEPGPTYRPAFVHGPAGIGKTTAVGVVFRAAGYRVLELNASDARSGQALREVLPDAQLRTSFGLPTAVIMDEADGLCGTADKGAVAALMKLVKRHAYPVVLIANDPYANDAVKGLLKSSQVFRFYPPTGAQLADRLLAIAKAEGLSWPANASQTAQLANHLGGDMRAAITYLYMQSLGGETPAASLREGGDRTTGLFESIGNLWMTQSRPGFVDHCIDVYAGDSYKVGAFMQENYLSAIAEQPGWSPERRKQAMAEAAECLSLGDTLFKRANTQVMGALVVARTCVATGPRPPKHIVFPKGALGGDSHREARRKRALTLLDKVSPRGAGRASSPDGWFNVLRARLFDQLAEGKGGDPKQVAQWMTQAHLGSEDWKTLAIDGWPGFTMPTITPLVKAALTRALTASGKGRGVHPPPAPAPPTPPLAKKAKPAFLEPLYTWANMIKE